MFKMLRGVQLNIGIEKIDIHEGVIVKVLLDSGATEMFMDKKIVARHGFKLQKLEKLVAVRNVNGTNNSAGAITYQCKGDQSSTLQEIPQLIIVYEIYYNSPPGESSENQMRLMEGIIYIIYTTVSSCPYIVRGHLGLCLVSSEGLFY